MTGKIYSLNISKVRKKPSIPVKNAKLIEDYGVEGDIHAEQGKKQVSLLAIESIDRLQECSKVKRVQRKNSKFKAGDFSENITTQGMDLTEVNIGDRFNIGAGIVLEISKIGKECHKYCAIYHKTGDCFMPRESIFANVLKGGDVSVGDDIEMIKNI